jgi:hypothetical protein
VQDMLGAPVAGAEVRLLHQDGEGDDAPPIITDEDGRASYTGDAYAAYASATELFGLSYDAMPSGDRVDFHVTAYPAAALTAGLGNVTVTGGSADGRSLRFSARLYVVEGDVRGDLEDWNIGDLSVLPCAPATGDPPYPLVPKCIEGPAGFDTAYTGTVLSKTWVGPAATEEPLALSLLLDQGSSVIVEDDADRRLLAAKYLQTQLKSGDQLLLAAFAADDVGSGQPALLPDQPATIYPVDAPGFTTDGASLFATIDMLAALEGGASPLHAAIDDVVEFTTARAPADLRRTVVALASGDDRGCGTRHECRAQQQTLLAKGAASEVSIVTVGLGDAEGHVDAGLLGTFAEGEHNAVFWAADARQVPTILGRLPAILDGRHAAIDISFELHSTVGGAFASRNVVKGTLHLMICPWECTDELELPFAVRVP